MEQGLLIITTEIDIKILNRLLLSIQFHCNGADPRNNFRLLRDISPGSKWVSPKTWAEAMNDGPPIQTLPKNEWVGLSIDEVEKYLIPKDDDCSTQVFLLLDDEGVQNQTIIVAERAYKGDDEFLPLELLEGYDKVRVPWFQANAMWTCMMTGDIHFREWCMESPMICPPEDGDFPEGWMATGADGMGERWWTFKGIKDNGNAEKRAREGFEKGIGELERLDLA